MNAPFERSSGRRWARLAFAGAAWLSLAIAWIVYQRRSGLGPVDTAQELVDTTRGNWWAIIGYLVISLLRPLVLFPASVVTVAAGLLFGPVVGVAVAAVSANVSALIAHRLDEGVGGIDPATLSVSVLLVVASITALRVIKRRQRIVALAPQE